MTNCTSHISHSGNVVYCNQAIGHRGAHESADLRWTRRAPITVTAKDDRDRQEVIDALAALDKVQAEIDRYTADMMAATSRAIAARVCIPSTISPCSTSASVPPMV